MTRFFFFLPPGNYIIIFIHMTSSFHIQEPLMYIHLELNYVSHYIGMHEAKVNITMKTFLLFFAIYSLNMSDQIERITGVDMKSTK